MADSRIIITPHARQMIQNACAQDQKINLSVIARAFGVSRQRIHQLVRYKNYEVDLVNRVTMHDLLVEAGKVCDDCGRFDGTHNMEVEH